MTRRTDFQPAPAQRQVLDQAEPRSTRLLRAEDVADRWQVPPAHVYRLARRGDLEAVELGRYKRFRLDAVEAFERNGGTK